MPSFEDVVQRASTRSLRRFTVLAGRSVSRSQSAGLARALRIARAEVHARTLRELRAV